MTFTNELFEMDDFVMTDSPAISSSPHLQALPAADNRASSDRISRMVTSSSLFDFSNLPLFPLIEDQISHITNNGTTTSDQFSFLDTWQEGSFVATSSRAQEFEQARRFQLQSGAATTHLQSISMVNTPDLSSVHTGSYSPSLHMPSNLDHGFAIEWNASLLLQQHQEGLLPLSYEAQQQDMVSPVSQFDLMHSPSNSYSIMEEQSVYSATPSIQSPISLAGHDDGRLYTTTILIKGSRSANADGKPRFDCPECDQTLSRSQDLQRHQKSCHSDIKSFCCDCCNRRFSRKDALKRHEKSKKSDRQKRRFQRQGQAFAADNKASP
ncbi:C2H2-type zinc finger transcription factor [Mucor lusitanicus]